MAMISADRSGFRRLPADWLPSNQHLDEFPRLTPQRLQSAG